jgi:hypothetical protein
MDDEVGSAAERRDIDKKIGELSKSPMINDTSEGIKGLKHHYQPTSGASVGHLEAQM